MITSNQLEVIFLMNVFCRLPIIFQKPLPRQPTTSKFLNFIVVSLIGFTSTATFGFTLWRHFVIFSPCAFRGVTSSLSDALDIAFLCTLRLDSYEKFAVLTSFDGLFRRLFLIIQNGLSYIL